MKSKIKLGLAMIAGGVFLALSGTASATLIGDTFDCTIDITPNSTGAICNGTDILIGEGVEYRNILFGDFWDFSVDIDESSILIFSSTIQGVTFSGQTLVFSSLDWVNNPTGIITGFTMSTDVPGFTSGDVTFDDHSVTLFFDEAFTINKMVLITLITDHTVVPEPASLAIFGFGLLGLGLARRRRKTA